MVTGCTYKTVRLTSGVVNEVGMAPPGDNSPKYLLPDVTPKTFLASVLIIRKIRGKKSKKSNGVS